MNLKTRSQAKSQRQASPKVNSKPAASQPKDDKSPRVSSATRERSAEIADTKAKRVRTGCLTCRERHLKCDEALGRCLNCRKSDRICRRGIRLNFIDIQTVAPPHTIARPHGAKVTFRDDSRFIASEYVGGSERYPPPQPESPIEERRHLQQDAFSYLDHDQLATLFQSVAHSIDPAAFDPSHAGAFIGGPEIWHSDEAHLLPGDELLPHGTSNFARKLAAKQFYPTPLSDPEQVLLLQAYVDEVGCWMDSLDSTRYFSQILPMHAIGEPVLLKAFMACGARHLSLVDPTFDNQKAAKYYDEATQDLMIAMHDPNRDSVLCTTAALILSIYEILAPQQTQSTNHIGGSRALIRECGWTARTPGLGSASFWISVGMELLSALHYKWTLSWNPDTWGVDMTMQNNTYQAHVASKTEEVWLHRAIYICAKVANFRITAQSFQSINGSVNYANELSDVYTEWSHYDSLCQQWHEHSPRTLKPLGHIPPWQTQPKSSFPRIWLPNRLATVSQLFYHTACLMLGKAHPLQADYHRTMQQVHAHDICGIVANTKDKGVINVSIRCLALAAECLDTEETQKEVLSIFDTLVKDTSWHAEPIQEELKQIWGVSHSHQETMDPSQLYSHQFGLDPSLLIPKGPEFPPGLSNPLLDVGDFSMDNHPYQEHYVAPHHLGLDPHLFS
ncbi:hypothetical protein N7539_003743 [Penicillium diatomitis]|uniref:Zn(2)-C6 fungal-type domain-containing protein n=1 Tax=Penicillium diatomitis TaxID=2819901 RepID=A0A9W9XD62_9EURO|nr:uncharacterized protein N7539_003743 [Penicillium diatomitis]KAJ5488853.1 hypothetical protein N7539_003743 [Penicillium diatomitis]